RPRQAARAVPRPASRRRDEERRDAGARDRSAGELTGAPPATASGACGSSSRPGRSSWCQRCPCRPRRCRPCPCHPCPPCPPPRPTAPPAAPAPASSAGGGRREGEGEGVEVVLDGGGTIRPRLPRLDRRELRRRERDDVLVGERDGRVARDAPGRRRDDLLHR